MTAYMDQLVPVCPRSPMVHHRGGLCALTVLAFVVLLAPHMAFAQDPSDLTISGELPPAGFGTLGQDDIGIRLRTTNLMINVIPLAENVIRLLAPDTYSSLHRLVESKSQDLDEESRRYGIDQPTLFLVTFFGTQPQARFDPEALLITGQSRLLRPIAVLPLSPSFGDRQVGQRETANAIYIYEGGLSLFDPFEIRYESVSTNQWQRILRIVDRERAAVEARAAAARRDTSMTVHPIRQTPGTQQLR